LSRNQFFIALRLVALAQSGRSLQFWAQETNVPIPKFDQIPVPVAQSQPQYHQTPPLQGYPGNQPHGYPPNIHTNPGYTPPVHTNPGTHPPNTQTNPNQPYQPGWY